MIDNDFSFIESRLNVVLPLVFQDFMRAYPNDATHQLENKCDILPTNAELFLISQLRRSNNGRDFDYYELQPELRDRRFLDIGGDGIGNYYWMVGDDRDSDELWIWEHDPYDGFSVCEMTLTEYLGPEWQLTSREDPFATTPSDGMSISRANHPHRSILEPITIEEWRDYVERTPILELDEDFDARNPFTNEIVKMKRWPGRALLSIDDSPVHISYHFGGLVLAESASLSRIHYDTMQLIANDLNANLF